MDSDKKLRALIIGAGYMGRRHIHAYARHRRSVVVGAVCRTDQSAQRCASDYDFAVFTDVAEALAAIEPDIVSVCSPTEHHVHHAQQAIAAGAHVLVEKPLADDIESGKDLVLEARKASRILMPAHTTLFEPATLSLARVARGGALGKLRRLVFTRRGLDVSPGEIEKGNAPDSFEYEETEDLGWLYDHLVHVTYLLNRLAGSVPERVAVGECTPLRFMETLRAKVGYRNGVVAELDITSEQDDPFSKSLRVEGERGIAEWEMRGGLSELRVRTEGGVWVPIKVPPGSAFDGVVHHFVDAVLGDVRQLESGEDGLRAMALASALSGGRLGRGF